MLTPEFGAALRQAREAKGLRLEDIAARLRIQAHYLHAMESGNVKALPPNPYRSAFIKQYASTLGVSLTPAAPPQERKPDTIAKATELATTAAKATVEAVQSASKATESAMKKSVTGVKEAIDELTSRELWEEAEQVRRERLGLETPSKPEPAGFKIKETADRRSYTTLPPATPHSESKEDDEEYADVYPQRMSRASKIVIGLLVVATSIILYFIFFNTSTKQLQIVGQSQPSAVSAETHDSAEESEPAATLGAGDSMVLVLTAKEKVWVSVTPDNHPGYRGMIEAGTTKTFIAANRYLLYLGNQHALDIVFDGRKLSQLPSIPNSKVVVRGLVLTRDKVYTDTTAVAQTPSPPPPTTVKLTPTSPARDTTVKNPQPVVVKPLPARQKEPAAPHLPGPVRRPTKEPPVITLDTNGKVE